MKPFITACAALLLLFAGVKEASCAPVSFWFEKAGKLYEQQSYDSAAWYYEQILSSGVANSAVYYNLGNSYFRQKKVGLALLNYERARKLAPTDADVLANIKFANSVLIDRIPIPQQSFAGAILFRLHTLFPLNTQLWILFFLLLALAGLFSAGLYASRNARLWIVYLSSLLLLVACAVGASAGAKIYASERTAYAIVLVPSLDAKNEPNGSKLIFTVHEGTKFRIRKTIGEWSLVSLPTGMSGWVQTASLGKI
ncbi:MAG TPA: tetratricopeptide repeat protein [Chitinivibrionales bacterium]|nr:tetratricopeptide repeat protein [Chitinivibrionales bacterium]